MATDNLRYILDGTMEIVKITKDLYDPVIELFKNEFMRYETVSIACDLLENEQTIAEMTTLVRATLDDGISYAAIDIKSLEIAGVCISKIVNPSANISLYNVFASFKTPNMKAVIKYLNTMENTYNIFTGWNVKSVIELSFLMTCEKYARRGIAKALVKYLLHCAARINQKDITVSMQLPNHTRLQKPKAVVAVFTSRYSQLIGQKLGFTVLHKENNNRFVFRNKTFAEKIPPRNVYSIFAAKMIEY